MKLTKLTLTAALMMTAGAAYANPTGNGPCNPGNAVFCGTKGEKGDTGERGPAGPAGHAGQDGKDGQDGRDGTNGRDGRDFDSAAHARALARMESQMAADRAVGSLQTRTPRTAGEWTGSAGFSGTQHGVDGVSVGARYGLSDRSDLYMVIGQSFDGHTSFGVGATFVLGGGQ